MFDEMWVGKVDRDYIFNKMFYGMFQTQSSPTSKSVDNAADKDGVNVTYSDGDESPPIQRTLSMKIE